MWGGGRKTKRQLVDLRHERAMDIRDEDVAAVNEAQWVVTSQGGGGSYDVHLEAANCPRNSCREWAKCFADGCGGLCAHMYRCTCPDENTLCKHIHKVRIVRKARSALKSISHALDRFDSDALHGVIRDAAAQLAEVCHDLQPLRGLRERGRNRRRQ